MLGVRQATIARMPGVLQTGLVSCLLHAIVLLTWEGRWLETLEPINTSLGMQSYSVNLISTVGNQGEVRVVSRENKLLIPLSKPLLEPLSRPALVKQEELPVAGALPLLPRRDPVEFETQASVEPVRNVAPLDNQQVIDVLVNLDVPSTAVADASDVETNGGNEAQQLLALYRQQLQAWLAGQQYYPRKAQLRKRQGTAIVSFRISTRGDLEHAVLEQGSGFSSLDNAALKTLMLSKPPKPPMGFEREQLHFSLPIVFVLN